VDNLNYMADYNFGGRLQFWWHITILVQIANFGDGLKFLWQISIFVADYNFGGELQFW
jgi:hypothetical protein